MIARQITESVHYLVAGFEPVGDRPKGRSLGPTANGSMLLQWIRILMIAYGVLKFGLRLIEWKTTEVVVTNTRVVVKRGLISRRTKEINVSRIESVNVDQSVLGRTLGYGTVTVQGTGGGIAPLAYVAKPLMLRGQLLAEPRTADEMAFRRAIS